MISQAQIKKYASLKQKKYRKELGLFVVEGLKSVEELLVSNLKIEIILGAASEIAQLPGHIASVEPVDVKTLSRISSFKTPSSILAIVEIPKQKKPDYHFKTIIIENIQDPGNLGTIIRTAHWFGFEQIVCSGDSVDLYNSKTIQSSMGAVFKLPVIYTDLGEFINKAKSIGVRVLGTFMEGKSIYEFPFMHNDMFVLGNEGQGISKAIEALVDDKITIPNFSIGLPTESLNIASATAVVCSAMAQ
ncbi:MAG: RNA methyltransferase [Bacteroidales bacterium]|nr:RNA methyltransferase [Bacteroidales bacterium]